MLFHRLCHLLVAYRTARIGSGTGIFTRALLAHPDWADTVKELRAIEPSAGMRDQFTKSVQDPRVSLREGTFDATGIEDGWADLIVIAQVRLVASSFEVIASHQSRSGL